jgi:hypothetical protein
LCPVGRFRIAEYKFISLKEEITMRVSFTFSRVALVLAVVWMAMGMPAGAFANESASGSPQVVIAEPTTPANLLNYTEYYETADAKAPAAKEAAPATDGNCNQGCGACACECCCEPCREWYVEPEVQQMFGYTSFQFGFNGPTKYYPAAYAPASKLDYSLDSTWTGLRVGVERCNWDVHFEWLMPMVQHIDGGMKDYDWPGPNTAPNSLTRSSTQWNDGQKLELEADYKYSDCILGMPIEVWPLAGFRFQRFDITAYNLDSIIPDTGPDHRYDGVDVLTINQQYYIGYIGFQLRRTIERECRPPINLAFQFDWGGTAGYMVDHHLLYGTRNFYNMQSTGGDTVHVALRGDIPLNCHWNLGLQADYYRIRTTGSMTQLLDGHVNNTGFESVLVKSEQTDITAYLQYTF